MSSVISEKAVAARITVEGTVQGVGFRPFVFSLAQELSLPGSVRNAGSFVEIELIGPTATIEQFLSRLKSELPPLAVIDALSLTYSDLPGELPPTFAILESSQTTSSSSKVPPDIATCADCLSEIFDSTNRRYMYPFTNCTNCGPRFTVIESLPYDRETTTMACFPMCEECKQEYEQPGNRRFHAQPNACWICGPQLTFLDAPGIYVPTVSAPSVASRRDVGMPALQKAVDSLRHGEIVAVKGLGGFHLVCDASNQEAVMRLRQRKRRNTKPFAVMFRNLDQVSDYCQFHKDEAKLLTGARSPIVLLKRKPEKEPQLAADVSNGLGDVGVMLPYTPLQYLLMERFGAPLVMTSGNLHEEPIAVGNRESAHRLKNVADRFLLHNRDICCRFDDSVTRSISNGPVFIRRARGFAPETVTVPIRARNVVLALGPELKTTFTFVRDNQAYVSQHIGDTGNPHSLDFLEQTVSHYKRLFGLEPQLLACDLHPDYQTTRLAQQWSNSSSLPLVQVQHHHAHIASCMAEHGVSSPVIGVAFDGSGYGDDGTIWGGEFFLCDLKDYRRVGRLSPVELPGGEAAIRNPWRMAVSYLAARVQTGDRAAEKLLTSIEQRIDKHQVAMVTVQITRQLNTPLTSSCGRLFDAVSSLLGLCDRADFEGQAAMLLEAHARQAVVERGHLDADRLLIEGGPFTEIDTKAIIGSVAERLLASKLSIESIALEFHVALAEATVSLCRRLAKTNNTNTVCLSGGVFQNKVLTELIVQGLNESGLVPLIQRKVPANDGGISLGQAVVAAARDDNGSQPCA